MVHIRTESEINKISKSCQIVADTLLMLEEYVHEGMKISKLDSLAEEFIRSRGARPAWRWRRRVGMASAAHQSLQTAKAFQSRCGCARCAR